MTSWNYGSDEDRFISDKERRCFVTDAFGRCIGDDERRAAARRLRRDCEKCPRESYCFVAALMWGYDDPEE